MRACTGRVHVLAGGGGGGGAIFDMIDAVTVFYSLVILVRSTDPRA